MKNHNPSNKIVIAAIILLCIKAVDSRPAFKFLQNLTSYCQLKRGALVKKRLRNRKFKS